MRKEGFGGKIKLNCNDEKLWHSFKRSQGCYHFLSYCKDVQITGEGALEKTPARHLVRKREALNDQNRFFHLYVHSWELRANLKME